MMNLPNCSYPFQIFNALRVSTLGCILGFLLSGQMPAQDAGYAKGMAIYLAPGDTPLTARAILYRKYTKAHPYSYFDTGASSPMPVENGRILKLLDLAPLYADVSSDAEKLVLERFSKEIASISQQYPKSSEVCKSLTQVLDGFLNRYANGEVRLNGAWENGQAYRDRLAAAQQAAMDRTAMLQKLQEEDQMEYDNLTAAYTPRVTELLQTAYEDYKEEVGQFLENTKAEKIGLGPMEPGLHGRSKLIPRPPGTDQAGIYAGDSKYGPVVIWTTQDDDIVSMMVGVTFLMNPDTNQIGNERELTQAQFFLDRYQTGLVDILPIFLAAAKIQRVQGKPVTVKTYNSPSVIMDVYVHNPVTLGSGEVVQHVILRLF